MTNRKFDLKSEELAKKTPHSAGVNAMNAYEKDHTAGIDFQLLDGNCHFLRHGHMLHMEFKLEDKHNVIRLMYSTHTVVVQGYRLKPIYETITKDQISAIIEIEERYANMIEETEPCVVGIKVITR